MICKGRDSPYLWAPQLAGILGEGADSSVTCITGMSSRVSQVDYQGVHPNVSPHLRNSCFWMLHLPFRLLGALLPASECGLCKSNL
jgi:hypothetical protein